MNNTTAMILPQRESRENKEEIFCFCFFAFAFFLLLWSTTSQRFPSSSSRVCGVSDFAEEEKRQKRED